MPDAAARVADAIAAVEADLGRQGRVLVRPSGTEPLVRVMVEAPTQARADEAAARIARAVQDQAR
jgi:phosphoglucosamine mutase